VIVVGAVLISLPDTIPLLGFQYTFWQMDRILGSASENELRDRVKDLPEVKTFQATYKNSTWDINEDYHIGVVYSITECQYSGIYCNEAKPYHASLEIVMSLDTGYPDHSHFWCKGDDYGKAPLGYDGIVRAIQECA